METVTRNSPLLTYTARKYKSFRYWNYINVSPGGKFSLCSQSERGFIPSYSVTFSQFTSSAPKARESGWLLSNWNFNTQLYIWFLPLLSFYYIRIKSTTHVNIVVFRHGVYKRLLCKHGKIMLIRLYVHVLMMMIRLFSGFYTVLLSYLDYTWFGSGKKKTKKKIVLIFCSNRNGIWVDIGM